MLHCYTATFGIFNEKVMEMNKEMYLTEHLVLPSEATLSQTSELDGVCLSPHFSLAEMTVTNVKRVNNIPGPEEVENLKRLCGGWNICGRCIISFTGMGRCRS